MISFNKICKKKEKEKPQKIRKSTVNEFNVKETSDNITQLHVSKMFFYRK